MKKLFVFAAAALMSMSLFAENITVAQAIAIGDPLNSGDKTTESYTVEGYVVKWYNNYYNGTQSFYMHDEKDFDGYCEFEAFKAKVSGNVYPGTKVAITGQIEKYNSTIEIKDCTCEILEAAVPASMTYAEALVAGQAVKDPNDGKTNYSNKYVKFRAYVTSAFDPQSGKQDAWLSDDKDAEKGGIQAFKLAIDAQVAKGDYVEVIGVLAKYKPNGGEVKVELAEGSMAIVDQPAAIENTAVSVKAQKVMENGQLYIIRNGVKYNAAGAVVE